MMSLLRTVRFITSHPLNRAAPFASLTQFACWQIGSRLLGHPIAIPFVDDSRLLVSSGMTGATGNVYSGLHEFEDMGFVLHVLREGDLFVDIGANVGTYTVLAAAVCGANAIAVEPAPKTLRHLKDNLQLNNITGRVEVHECAVVEVPRKVCLTSGLDTMNHIATEATPDNVEVEGYTLDDIVAGRHVNLIKIDVEGYEQGVLEGGKLTLGTDSLFGVVLEANGSNARYGLDARVPHEILTGAGFRPFRYAPFDRLLREIEDVSRVDGNTLYLRSGESVATRVKEAPRRRVGKHSL